MLVRDANLVDGRIKDILFGCLVLGAVNGQYLMVSAKRQPYQPAPPAHRAKHARRRQVTRH